MSTNNYTVKQNTIWTGVVEDTDDPLHLGRCKVRIFGVHTDLLTAVPTKDLPWAMPLNSVNTRSFATPLEGDYVMGFFQDGISSQVPIILGITPSIPAKIVNTTRGFSSQSKKPIKKDLPNNLKANEINMPSTPPGARGDYANTNVSVTNSALSHSCDFRYFIQLPKFDMIGLVDPVAAIQEAIKNGKNQAAQLMRALLVQMTGKLREVINGLLPALGLDPSGELSKTYSIAKDLFRKINAAIKKIAIIVETASLYYNLVKDITMIVDYLKSLPDRIKAVVQECLTQFLSSVTNFVNQIKSVPGVVSGTIDSMLAQLGISSQSALSSLQGTSANTTSNTANTIANTTSSLSTTVASIIVYNATTDGANLINNYISQNFANATVTYTKTNTQAP